MSFFHRASRLALLLAVLPTLASSPAAFAQVPNADQASCIVAWNKAAGGLAKASAGAVRSCVTAAIKGKESAPQACTTSDPKGKIAKATDKLHAVGTGACAGGAPFGFAGPASGSPSASASPREVAASLFGEDLDAGVFAAGSNSSACQSAMLKATLGTLSASFKEFAACKKAGLAAGALSSSAQLDTACFAAIATDAKGKIAKARAKIDAAGSGPCSGGVAADALPGDCAAAPSPAACADARVSCALCRMIDGVDGLHRDCDAYDDGAANGSCSTCGNGVIESGELCDDGAANGQGCCSLTCGAANTGAACDDGDLCTVADTCASGACVGTAPDCSSYDGTCTVGVCDAGTGNCQPAPANNGAGCSDGNACTVGDTCSAGSCVGTAVDCSAFDGACTAGVCNAGTGVCESTPAHESLSCDDGNVCTDGDACTAGLCVGSPVPPSSVVLEDDFPGTSLDPAWQVSLAGVATGWTGGVHDSLLEVTDVANGVSDEWGRVRFDRTIPATGDLRATFQVNWNSEGSNAPIQYLWVELRDAAGARIALASCDDSWAAASGDYVACDNTGCSSTGQGSLPLSGSETFLIERINDALTIKAGATTLRTSTTIATAATTVHLEAGFWNWSGGNFFGTLSTDLVKLESLNTACMVP